MKTPPYTMEQMTINPVKQEQNKWKHLHKPSKKWQPTWRRQVTIKQNVPTCGLGHFLAQHEPLDQGGDVVVFSLMSERPHVGAFQVDLPRSQIIQNHRKYLWVPVDENSPLLISETRDSAAEQRREKRVGDQGQRLAGRRKPAQT